MLDKETLLRQEISLPKDEKSLEDFLSCLQRAKEITDLDENLRFCIEKILGGVEEKE